MIEPFLLVMTTSPRSEPTIHRSVESLRSIGFHENLHIFAEPDSERPIDPSVIMHLNDNKLGSFLNHYQALEWAAKNIRSYQSLILLEDDVLFRKDFYKLIFKGPETSGLIVGLTHEWTVKEHHPYLRDRRGWCELKIEYGLNNVHGGQCYLIPCRILQRIMQHRLMEESVLRAGAGQNIYYTDNIIVASSFPGPVWVHIPSLCQHIGSASYFFKPDDPNDPLKDRRGYLFDEITDSQEGVGTQDGVRASGSSESLVSTEDLKDFNGFDIG